jgi:predicted MFS family arabinose efflux permease
MPRQRGFGGGGATASAGETVRSAIWIGIFVGSTIGGFVPALWGGDLVSYSGLLLSGAGAFVGLWVGAKFSR